MRVQALATVIVLLAAGASCKFPGSPPDIEYYAVDPVKPSPAAERAAHDGPRLRLRRIDASGHLKERMAWRTGEHGFRFEELARWTETPSAFLERSVARELFERRGLRRSESAYTPRLDLTLLAFEAAEGPETMVYVSVGLLLLDAEGAAVLEATVSRSARSTTDRPPDVADALSRALGEVVTDVSERVVRVL